MNAAKNGYVAEFVTGYLQREIRKELKVAGGTDAGLRDGALGFAPGRLVKIVDETIVPAVISDSNIYIVAQSDDTIRENPSDYNYQERYSNLPNLVCKNSDEVKTVALYKIVNKDDVKLVKITEPVDILIGAFDGEAFGTRPMTYQILRTGINTFKVIGSVPKYAVGNAPEGNPAGNILTFMMRDNDLSNTSQLPDGDIYNRYSNEPSKPHNSATKSDFKTSDGKVILPCAIWVNNETKTFTITVEWVEGEVSKYVFDLSEAVMSNIEGV